MHIILSTNFCLNILISKMILWWKWNSDICLKDTEINSIWLTKIEFIAIFKIVIRTKNVWSICNICINFPVQFDCMVNESYSWFSYFWKSDKNKFEISLRFNWKSLGYFLNPLQQYLSGCIHSNSSRKLYVFALMRTDFLII